MAPTLLPLRVGPGVYRNGTPYQGRARWIAADSVRWIDGTIRPIGGWSPLSDTLGGALASLAGVPRGMEAWRGNDGTPWLAIGTTEKLHAFSQGELYDITPADLVVGAEDAAITGGVGSYGFATYGLGLYGVGSASSALVDADTWQMDVFGDFLVASLTADGRVLVWDRVPANDATVAAGAPTGVRGVVVTPERFLFALGKTGDVRTVTWASQETTETWTPAVDNTAGDYPLTTNGRLMCGRRGRNQTLLWTDTDLHAATYIGGSLIYSFTLLGENCGIIGPNAVALDNGVAFWMGARGFWVYDGFVRALPSDVSDYVFGRLNTEQRAKVSAVSISEYGEIWWFYPSNASLEIDSYVCYNVRENHWATGSLARTAAVAAGAFPYPIMASATGMIYEHERGNDRDGVTPMVESGPIQMGQGDQLLTVLRIIPDETNLGDVRATVSARLYPTASETSTPELTVREPTDVRITGRQVRVKLVEGVERDWRVGEFRLAIAPRGKR